MNHISTVPLRIPHADAVQAHHPAQWWYWSGRVESAEGQTFGCKCSFFAGEAVRGVLWGQMAHAACIDLATGSTRRHSRIWVGAPTRVAERFALSTPDQRLQGVGGDGHDRLLIDLGSSVFDLSLRAEGPPLAHYEAAAHRYAFGGYSYHYSRTRMKAHGSWTDEGGRRHELTGTLWFDRQVGALSPALYQGWQWFALQLDGGELMLFDFHQAHSERFAVWVGSDGSTQIFSGPELRLHSLDRWQSPRTGIVYPSAWRIETPLHRLRIEPCAADQEMSAQGWSGPAYWEGACNVRGSHRGVGYAELVGQTAGLFQRLRRFPMLMQALENPAVALATTTLIGRLGRHLPRIRPKFLALPSHDFAEGAPCR